MNTKIAIAAPALLLAACASQPAPDQPFGAPEPEHAQMVFVDLDGCRWWVIGNATERTWAPQTDTTGQQVCNATAAADGLPIDTGETETEALAETDASSQAAPAPEAPQAPASTPQPATEPAPAAPTPLVTAPAPAPSAAATPQATTSFIVQVATFASAENAGAAAQNFGTLGIPVTPGSAVVASDGFYRLELGPFASSSEAERALNSARAEGFADAFVKRR